MSLVVDIEKRLGSFHLRVEFEAENEILALLGASGCGKSMTLKCIAGVERPDSGHIELDGVTLYDSQRHICLPPQKRRVGYLFQSYALFPNMTVRQNILCGLHDERDRAARERAVSEAAKMLQLTDVLGRRPAQISGGQAQRAALARILVSRPRLSRSPRWTATCVYGCNGRCASCWQSWAARRCWSRTTGTRPITSAGASP